MQSLTGFGLDTSRFTVLVMLLVLVMGGMSYFSLPKREDPAITIRTAAAIARFDGMSPERIENLIAIPIERKMREIGAIMDIETIIQSGKALFYVDLRDDLYGTAIEDAWEDLRNKMDDVRADLPAGTIGPIVNTDYGDVSIATIAVTGDGFDLAVIADAAEDLQKALYQVPGVTKVTLFGEQEERIWLDLDARKLASVGVQITQLLEDLRGQNVILPAGEIDADGTRIVLEANGDLRSVDEIRGVLTKVAGLSGFVRLADLVGVRRGFVDPKDGPVFFNGDPAVVLAVEMSDAADIQVLGRLLKERIESHELTQPIGIAYHISTFQETNVTAAVNNALSNVGQTFVVVFVVMLLFLGLRAAIVIACIVPFTICFALASMGFLGIDIEQVSIAAVIISLGLLVDNGLVVVEDIETKVNAGVDPREAAEAAGSQYTVPLAVASVTTISAFIPMLLLSGSEGEFAYSLGAVVAAMLFGSWLTSLYILPFLAVLLLKPKAQSAEPGPLTSAYAKLSRRLLPFGALSTIATLLVVGASLSQFAFVKPQMFPYSERADFLIYMDMSKDTAISETERLALRVEEWLSDRTINPGVVNSTIYIGEGGPRFYLSLAPADPDPASAFFAVNTTDLDAAIDTARRARRVFVEQFPEARFRVTRLSQGGNESGIVDVEITGPEADTLLAAAREVEAGFAQVPDLIRNDTDWGGKVVKLVVDIAQDRAREFGITSEDISEVMAAYFSGTTYSIYREGDEQIPIVLRATEASRDSIEDLANLSVAAGGALISVDQIATFRPRLEFSEIRRMNQVRQIVISAKSASLSAVELLSRIQPTLDALDLGPDYAISIGGEIEDSTDAYTEIGSNLPVALGIMIAALMFQFNSARRTLATFLTIPLIMIGAPFGLLILGHPMSFFAVLGLMSLMGIIINNAIVLIDQIDLERQRMGLEDAIVEAARQRARPIILTSLTTVFGLLPMAIAGGALFEPMAAIMISGLLVASPVTLIFVPGLCYVLMRERRVRLQAKAAFDGTAGPGPAAASADPAPSLEMRAAEASSDAPAEAQPQAGLPTTDAAS